MLPLDGQLSPKHMFIIALFSRTHAACVWEEKLQLPNFYIPQCVYVKDGFCQRHLAKTSVVPTEHSFYKLEAQFSREPSSELLFRH